MAVLFYRIYNVLMEGTPGSIDADHRGAQPFESEELLRMRRAAADKNFLIFTLLRNTGLRRSDAVKLTWAEIDFRNKIIRRKTQKRGKVVEIPLMPELQYALEFERDKRKPKSDDVVLLNPATGKPLSPRKLTARIRTLGTRVGILRATPHRFRDTFAVDLLYKGMDIYTVAKVLGDTVGVVEKHYAKFTTALRERARQIMLSGTGLEEAQFSTQSELTFEYGEEKKEVVAAGPVSRILSAGFDAAGRPFLWAAHYCTAQATYPKV